MARLLSPLRLTGIVTQGFGRGGKELGCPTANMDKKAVDTAKNLSTVPNIYHGRKSGVEYTLIEHNPQKRGVVYIPGFNAGQDTEESIILKKYFQNLEDSNFLCYDPRGIGMSDLTFSDCNLSTWIEDACRMIDMMHEITNTPPLVLSKSLGGHMATCIAQRQLCEIHSMVMICPGINYGPVFHEFVKSFISKKKLRQLENGEVITIDLGDHENWKPFPYSMQLYEDSFANGIDKSMGQIEGKFPVRVIQGMDDKTVPFSYSLSLEIDQMYKSDDLQLTYIKNCDHQVIDNKYGFNIIKDTIKTLLES